MRLAPIVLFVYNRLWHTKQTVEALQKNELAKDSELIIFSDAPKTDKHKKPVYEVREYIKTISNFKNITIIERDKNWGLANSIIDGVTKIVNKYGKIIVLEDDIVTSQFFLTFMNEALTIYEKDKQVMSVSGFSPPVINDLPETFFMRGVQIWGFGLWKRSWALFETDPNILLEKTKNKKFNKYMKKEAMTNFSKLLNEFVKGNHDSWAVRFYASAIINKGYTLFPKKPLTKNIGMDNTGIHCKGLDPYIKELYNSDIENNRVELKRSEHIHHCDEALIHFRKFFKKAKGRLYYRAKNRVKTILNKILNREKLV